MLSLKGFGNKQDGPRSGCLKAFSLQLGWCQSFSPLRPLILLSGLINRKVEFESMHSQYFDKVHNLLD